MVASRGTQGVLQVGPEQLFAAAQRAEADGHVDYAGQIYRQLSDTYPTTREAYDARDALARLAHTAQAQHEPVPTLHTQPPSHHPAQAPQGWQAPQRAQPHLQTHGPPTGHPMAAPRREPVRRAAHSPMPQSAPEAPAVGNYRIGRLVALTLTSMGWLLLFAAVLFAIGLVAALSVGSMPRALRELAIKQLPLGLAAAAGMLFLSLMAIFAGQAARAVFDTAETVRHLLARDGRTH